MVLFLHINGCLPCKRFDQRIQADLSFIESEAHKGKDSVFHWRVELVYDHAVCFICKSFSVLLLKSDNSIANIFIT